MLSILLKILLVILMFVGSFFTFWACDKLSEFIYKKIEQLRQKKGDKNDICTRKREL